MVFSEKWLKNHPNFITVSDTNSDLNYLYYDHFKKSIFEKSMDYSSCYFVPISWYFATFSLIQWQLLIGLIQLLLSPLRPFPGVLQLFVCLVVDSLCIVALSLSLEAVSSSLAAISWSLTAIFLLFVVFSWFLAAIFWFLPHFLSSCRPFSGFYAIFRVPKP